VSLYFLHLGRNKNLSFAEVSAVFGNKIKYIGLVNNELLKIETDLEAKTFEESLKTMGSIKKISKVLKTVPRELQTNALTNETAQTLEAYFISTEHKCRIGLNKYGISLPLNTIGMGIKKILKEKNIKLRIIEKNKKNLNSVSIIKNKLITDRGADLNFINDNDDLHIARTIACQDSLFYSKRDYDRPRRNAKNGMLPPKLCQIMLNLANVKKDDCILDPFCGVGTVLQEAMLKQLYFACSDIREDIIFDCRENLEWFVDSNPNIAKYYNPDKIKVCDATKIENCYTNQIFDAIVTEGTLGPPQSNFVDKQRIETIFKNLKNIYTPFFNKVHSLLKQNGRLVITFPAIRSRHNRIEYFSSYLLKNTDTKMQIITEKNLINPFSLIQSKSFKLIYERPDQIVLREIIVFEKRNNL